jgi:hypothetical protein
MSKFQKITSSSKLLQIERLKGLSYSTWKEISNPILCALIGVDLATQNAKIVNMLVDLIDLSTLSVCHAC